MGYTTWFDGSLQFNKEVTPQLKEYINRFSNTRRMKRDNEKIKELYPNWRELCFFGDLGKYGEYFAPISEDFGQEKDESIIGYNDYYQPSLWCQWIINDDNELEHDGGEKFYNYIEWLEYLIKNFFAPLGYVLNGEISWEGEDSDDIGIIKVEDNDITVVEGDAVTLGRASDQDLIEELIKRGYIINK